MGVEVWKEEFYKPMPALLTLLKTLCHARGLQTPVKMDSAGHSWTLRLRGGPVALACVMCS